MIGATILVGLAWISSGVEGKTILIDPTDSSDSPKIHAQYYKPHIAISQITDYREYICEQGTFKFPDDGRDYEFNRNYAANNETDISTSWDNQELTIFNGNPFGDKEYGFIIVHDFIVEHPPGKYYIRPDINYGASVVVEVDDKVVAETGEDDCVVEVDAFRRHRSYRIVYLQPNTRSGSWPKLPKLTLSWERDGEKVDDINIDNRYETGFDEDEGYHCVARYYRRNICETEDRWEHTGPIDLQRKWENLPPSIKGNDPKFAEEYQIRALRIDTFMTDIRKPFHWRNFDLASKRYHDYGVSFDCLMMYPREIEKIKLTSNDGVVLFHRSVHDGQWLQVLDNDGHHSGDGNTKEVCLDEELPPNKRLWTDLEKAIAELNDLWEDDARNGIPYNGTEIRLNYFQGETGGILKMKYRLEGENECKPVAAAIQHGFTGLQLQRRLPDDAGEQDTGSEPPQTSGSLPSTSASYSSVSPPLTSADNSSGSLPSTSTDYLSGSLPSTSSPPNQTDVYVVAEFGQSQGDSEGAPIGNAASCTGMGLAWVGGFSIFVGWQL